MKELLPAELSPLVEYHGVDATHYDSMRGALNHVKGEVCIATDGLPGYFNESEMSSMCANVRRLLGEFGGRWITGDVTNEGIYGATFGTLMQQVRPHRDALRKHIDALARARLRGKSCRKAKELSQNNLHILLV